MSSGASTFRITGASASELVASVETGLRTGRLVPGALLPTVRALAAELGVSPTTVAAAYKLLAARGLLSAAGRRGSRISPRPPLALPRVERAPAHLRNLAEGNPDPRFLPTLSAALRGLPRRSCLYGELSVLPALQQAARRAFERDGIVAERLAVVHGAMDGVERVLMAHLRPGDRVAVEDPGYPAVLDLLGALGLVPEAVPLDQFGLTPAGLARAIRAGARAVVATPRAQNPTGAVFDPERLRALERLLRAHANLLWIEDDHAGDVAGAPARSLCGASRRWAVVRSVSKSLGPDLRLALLVGDDETVARVEGRQALGCGWVSHLIQQTVATLLDDRAVLRLLRSAAETYRERREALIAALRRRGLEAQGAAGLNVWLPVREESPPLQALAAAGWAVRAGERYRLKSPPALRITTATLLPSDAERLAADLAGGLRPERRGRGV